MAGKDLVPRAWTPPRLNKVQRGSLAHARRAYDQGEVGHVSQEAVFRIAQAAWDLGRGHKKDRDRLLILTLFDGCLRVSEALQLTPKDLIRTPRGYRLRVRGKGLKEREVAISPSLAAALYAYIMERSLRKDDRLFPINRTRAFQIVQRAFQRAGIRKPDGVGYCHVLRHSGAIARLRRTGNLRSVQHQLGHKTSHMTLRYFKTLQREESIAEQEEIDLWQ